jgi:hypothetical protein
MLICDCGLLVKIRSGLGGVFFSRTGRGRGIRSEGNIILTVTASTVPNLHALRGSKGLHCLQKWQKLLVRQSLGDVERSDHQFGDIINAPPRKSTNAVFHTYLYTSVRHARKAPLEPIL